MMKRLTITLYLLLFGMLSATQVTGQQTPIFSQYHTSPFIYNPSLAGSMGNTQIALLTRQQWIGYENYPGTYWVSAEGRLVKRSYVLGNIIGRKTFRPRRDKSRFGLGGSIASDRNGLLHETSMSISCAYHIFLHRTQLSMGLGLFVSQLSVNERLIEVVDVNDPKLQRINENQFFPDFNIGVSLRHHSYTAGISALSLMQTPLKLGNNLINYTLYRHYHAFFSYNIPLNKEWLFTPHLLGVFTETGRYYVDLMTGFSYNQQYHINAAYRNQSDLIIQIGITLPDLIMSNELYIGYAFDYPLFSVIRPNNMGAHELLLRIGIGSSTRRDRWIDRF